MVPHIPPELIAHIIKLSLPPLSFDTFPARYTTLVSFRLVNKQWSALASSELFLHLSLPSHGAAEKLENCFGGSSFDYLFARTKSLWIGDDRFVGDSSDLKPVDAVTHRCIALESFSARYINVGLQDCIFSGVNGESLLYFKTARTINSCQRRINTGVRSITLKSVYHDSSNLLLDVAASFKRLFQGSFARLTHLSLVDFVPEGRESGWDSIFAPSVVTELRHLIYVAEHKDWLNNTSFVQALDSIAAQLESFAFVDYALARPPNLSTLWAKLVNIKHLYLSIWIDVYHEVMSQLDTLAAPALTSLVLGINESDNSLIEAANACKKLLQTSSTFLPALKTLSLLGWSIDDFATDLAVDEMAADQAYRELQSIMESRGGTLLVDKRKELGMAPAWAGYECPWCASRFRRSHEPLILTSVFSPR